MRGFVARDPLACACVYHARRPSMRTHTRGPLDLPAHGLALGNQRDLNRERNLKKKAAHDKHTEEGDPRARRER
jgi:hypothetical protein